MELRTDIAASPAAKRGRRLLTAGHLDRRTRGVKRARTIAAELERGWDGITPVQRQAIERASMLSALAEDLALAGSRANRSRSTSFCVPRAVRSELFGPSLPSARCRRRHRVFPQ